MDPVDRPQPLVGYVNPMVAGDNVVPRRRSLSTSSVNTAASPVSIYSGWSLNRNWPSRETVASTAPLVGSRSSGSNTLLEEDLEAAIRDTPNRDTPNSDDESDAQVLVTRKFVLKIYLSKARKFVFVSFQMILTVWLLYWFRKKS